MNKDNPTEFILNAAMMQDSLLQSYRSFNLILQSIFVGVGVGLAIAILSFSSRFQAYLALSILIVIFALSVFLLIRMRKIILARGEDVNFWHRELIKAEQSLSPEPRFFTQFKIHQKLKRENIQYLQDLFLTNKSIDDANINQLIEKGLSHTRIVIDKWLFRGLLIIWIIILVSAASYTFSHL